MKKLMAVLTIALALGATGCVATMAGFSPATAEQKAPTLKVYRFALLYPFEIADMSIAPDGVFKLGSYKSDGGEKAFASAFASGVDAGKALALKAAGL